MSSLILLRLVPFYNLYQRYTLLYMSLCSVLRKVAAGTYIGGYLFYIYLGWLPNGTVTIARSFLLIRVISGMERSIAEMM